MGKVIGSLFSSGPSKADLARDAEEAAARNASEIELTPEQRAEQRAALAAQGRRPKEDELRRQAETGERPLQGSGSQSSFWS